MDTFTAVIRTVSVQTVEVPITSASISQAQLAASQAVDALRSVQQDATLMRLNGPGGETLFCADNAQLEVGVIEVTWRARIRADNAEVAACLARMEQVDPESPLSVFETRDAMGRIQTIDLQRTGPLH